MDIKKEELELLGVNKASIYTTKKGRERTTAVKMLFKYAPIGTTLYYYQLDSNNFLLLTTPHKTMEPLAVREVRISRANKNIFSYINMWGCIQQSTYFSVYRYEDADYSGFYLSETTAAEKDAFAYKWSRSEESGKITKQSCMKLIRKDIDRLMKTGANFILTMHFGDRCYAELAGVPDASEYARLSELRCARGTTNKDKLNGIPVRINLRNNLLHLPKPFVEEGRIKPESHLKTWFAPGNKMIIEVDPVICDVCGKPINRYEEKLAVVDACKDCADAIPVASQYIHVSDKITTESKIADAKNVLLQELMELKLQITKLDTLLSA